MRETDECPITIWDEVDLHPRRARWYGVVSRLPPPRDHDHSVGDELGELTCGPRPAGDEHAGGSARAWIHAGFKLPRGQPPVQSRHSAYTVEGGGFTRRSTMTGSSGGCVLMRVAGLAAAQLLDPFSAELDLASRRMTAYAVIDEHARAAYRSRLDELEEQFTAALCRHKDDRTHSLDLERDALLAELRGAGGRGADPRRLGDPTERTRRTVTARIRDTLRHLDRRHPELADHLRATVSTGATYRYVPDDSITWLTCGLARESFVTC